ncbi:hypothetical protein HT136_03400 [Novosphingobium profundi]|uniref:hypothetical protein n=1 Tax=Novosphingobium profundi TaxID=1774954 RepID=UPI001BD9F881|nr:hypothetical protein [Novosphingobium profundi]MBT0667411.1 hypothetical protein [Novosphingobium profundi]
MSDSKVPVRLRGIVRLTDRGPLLEVEVGPFWRIQTKDDLTPYQDRAVWIEAWQLGACNLDLLWIGEG